MQAVTTESALGSPKECAERLDFMIKQGETIVSFQIVPRTIQSVSQEPQHSATVYDLIVVTGLPASLSVTGPSIAYG